LGGAGVVTLLIYAADPKAVAWCQPWFVATFSVSAVLAAMGLYVLAAVSYAPLPLPPTRGAREAMPRLFIADPHVLKVDDLSFEPAVIFEIGVANDGRTDVENAIANLLAPDFFVRLERCNRDGEVIGGGSCAPSSESVTEDDQGSIYWNGRVSFPGRVSRVLVFRGTLHSATLDPPEDFPVRLRIVAAELPQEVVKDLVVEVPEASE